MHLATRDRPLNQGTVGGCMVGKADLDYNALSFFTCVISCA
jgi:hypothetical protein